MMTGKQKGARNPNAKLDDNMVAHIKKCLADGICTQAALSKRYGVSKHMISLIALEKNWQHIKPSDSEIGPRVRHLYKADDDEFEAINCGAKTFVIVNGYERLYQLTDTLVIINCDENDEITRHLTRDIVYIASYDNLLKRNYCILGIGG